MLESTYFVDILIMAAVFKDSVLAMKRQSLNVLLLMTVYVCGLGAATIATSVFDTNDEGWTGLTATPSSGYPTNSTNLLLDYLLSGGNPGGHVSILDPDSNITYFSAPSSYLGNLGFALNGTLQFDVITDQLADYDAADVVIKGNGIVLVYDIVPSASSSWSTVIVPLSPGVGWHLFDTGGGAPSAVDFQTALGNVSDFWITAEYHNGVSENTGLDNVILSTADVPTPEPAAVFLVFPALACGLLLWRFRRAATCQT